MLSHLSSTQISVSSRAWPPAPVSTIKRRRHPATSHGLLGDARREVAGVAPRAALIEAADAFEASIKDPSQTDPRELLKRPSRDGRWRGRSPPSQDDQIRVWRLCAWTPVVLITTPSGLRSTVFTDRANNPPKPSEGHRPRPAR